VEDQQRKRSFYRRPRQASGDMEPDSAGTPDLATTPTPRDSPDRKPESPPPERERIVVPRQDRGSRYSGLDLN
jgi:hypothetical protein